MHLGKYKVINLKTMTKIELLSPAKNLQYGKEAIGHGADASHAVPDPCADTVDALRVFLRLHGQCHRVRLPPYLQRGAVCPVDLEQIPE